MIPLNPHSKYCYQDQVKCETNMCICFVNSTTIYMSYVTCYCSAVYPTFQTIFHLSPISTNPNSPVLLSCSPPVP